MKSASRFPAIVCLSAFLLPIMTTPVRAVDATQRAAQLAPFLNDQTIAVIGLRAQDVDLDAILRRATEVEALKPQAALLDELAGQVRLPLAGLRSANAEVYLFVRLGPQPTPEIGVVAFVPRESDREPIANLFRSLKLQDVKFVKDQVVASLTRTQNGFPQAPTDRSVELTAALAAAGSSPLQLLLIPSRDHRRVMQELRPRLPAELGGGDTSALASLLWGALSLDLEPSPEARFVVQTTGAAAASALRSALGPVLREFVKGQQVPGTLAPSEDASQRILPEVQGDRLLLTVNEENKRGQVLIPLIRNALQDVQQQVHHSRQIQSLKQLALAMHIYHDMYHQFPEAATRGRDGQPLLSWRVQLLPFLDQESLYKEFHLDEPWDSAHNLKMIARMPKLFAPASPSLQRGGKTVFLVPSGDKTVFPKTGGLKISEIRDGTVNTLLITTVVEKEAVVWTKPEDLEWQEADSLRRLTAGTSGFSVAFCDGSVRWIPSAILPETLRLLIDPADGQIVPSY